ncbi:hypothetical protein Hanom_Chr07g00639821 [Helianthus anomalus]
MFDVFEAEKCINEQKYDKGKCRVENRKLVSENKSKNQIWRVQAGRVDINRSSRGPLELN